MAWSMCPTASFTQSSICGLSKRGWQRRNSQVDKGRRCLHTRVPLPSAHFWNRVETMSDFELPDTRYALSGDVNIAFQVMGDGPIDIIMVPGVVSHIEFLHEFPGYTEFLRRLATFARVVTFDKRGQGLSDGISGAPSLEQRVDDVRAIMDDIGSQRAVLLGFSEGSPMSAFFAAVNPERVSKLILLGGFAKSWATDEGILQ